MIRPAAAILVRIVVIVSISFCTVSLPSKHVPYRNETYMDIKEYIQYVSRNFPVKLFYFESLNPLLGVIVLDKFRHIWFLFLMKSIPRGGYYLLTHSTLC